MKYSVILDVNTGERIDCDSLDVANWEFTNYPNDTQCLRVIVDDQGIIIRVGLLEPNID
jgi:hypothetical protein